MTEKEESNVPSRARCASQIGLMLAAIIVPQVVLAALGDRAPAALGNAIGLLTLPVAAVLAWWLTRGESGKLGLGRPGSWPRTLAFGLLLGAAVLVFAMMVVTPLLEAVFGRWLEAAMFDPLKGNLGALVFNVVLVSWLHAALCEEIIFRGFFLQRLERAFGDSRAALPSAVAVSSLLFGLAHYSQGLPGVVGTAIGGLLWATAFLRAERNLWVVVIGHATMDTTLFVLVFLGRHRLLLSG